MPRWNLSSENYNFVINKYYLVLLIIVRLMYWSEFYYLLI